MERTKIIKMEASDSFYDDAEQYWKKIPATIDGMLGGFGFISHTDIIGSKNFLDQVLNMKNPPGKETALDCGAGIGRITKNLLIKVFDRVDMVEQNPAFLQEAAKFIGAVHKDKLGTLYPEGLQNFTPEENKYDVIWIQWVLGHLRDDHFIEFFERCKKGLKPKGVIIVKENVTNTGIVEVDDNDSSVTRPLKLIRRLFRRATLQIVKEVDQPNFPKGLYTVRMFALRPDCLICPISSSEISLIEENNPKTIWNIYYANVPKDWQ